ncbi:hypothetical protein HRbin12_00794 [bacterium HR12]|nr:hypothetical protein HRbin12_00794 [bacterium HR12]
MRGARRLALALAAALPAVLPLTPASGGEAVRDAAEIQARIDAASPGATIVVEPGVYRGHLVVDRAVTLRGEGRAVIDGGGEGSVITITGDGAVVEGLEVRGSGAGPVGAPAGIRVEADGVLVRGNVVRDAYLGISAYGAEGLKVVGNRIAGRARATVGDDAHAMAPAEHPDDPSAADGGDLRGDGISLWDVEGALVRDNVVEQVRDGVYLSYGSEILVDRNVVRGSRYAIHSMFAKDLTVVECRFEANLSGAVMMYGGPVLLLRNEIRDSTSPSTGIGVLLKDVAGADVVENVVVGNRVGIQVDGPLGTAGVELRVRGNTVALNRFGVALYPSAQVTFSRNSFVENAVQVVAKGSGGGRNSTWYDEGLGNLRSDYRGYDLTGEGLGDVPYVGGGAVERLLVRAPVLEALASGPALQLLRAVEERWVERRPIVEDPLPLMSPVSPPLASGPRGALAPGVLGSGGLALTALALGVLWTARRRTGGLAHA